MTDRYDKPILETKEIKDKLKNIEKYMPPIDFLPEAYPFARYIADNLKSDKISPEGFSNATGIHALNDMVTHGFEYEGRRNFQK